MDRGAPLAYNSTQVLPLTYRIPPPVSGDSQ